jgi:hypothetical protein
MLGKWKKVLDDGGGNESPRTLRSWRTKDSALVVQQQQQHTAMERRHGPLSIDVSNFLRLLVAGRWVTLRRLSPTDIGGSFVTRLAALSTADTQEKNSDEPLLEQNVNVRTVNLSCYGSLVVAAQQKRRVLLL